MEKDLKNFAAESIRNRVLSMELRPSDVVDEVELAKEFGISRTPLREIVQRLSGEGYLVLQPNRGATVAPMDFGTMRHFFQAAPMIYAAISRLAAERAETSDIDELKDIQLRYRRSLEDKQPSALAMHNHAFHRKIGAMAASPYLQPSLDRLLIDHTRVGQTFYRSTEASDNARIAKTADQHDEMIDAFARRSPTTAVQLTLEHWELSRQTIEKYVQPDPLTFELEDVSHAV